MRGDRTIKTGDTYPPHIRVLTDADGVPIDLTGKTVKFVALLGPKATPTRRITAACTIMTIADALATGHLEPEDEAEAELWLDHATTAAAVVWDITVGDTTLAGAYEYEYEVTHAVGDVETWPTDAADNPTLTILDDLDAPA